MLLRSPGEETVIAGNDRQDVASCKQLRQKSSNLLYILVSQDCEMRTLNTNEGQRSLVSLKLCSFVG